VVALLGDDESAAVGKPGDPLLHALIEGAMLLHFLTPELMTEDAIAAAFAGFAAD
jgi:hypothetical protein